MKEEGSATMAEVKIVLDRECAVKLRAVMSERVKVLENLDLEFQKNGIPLTDWMKLEELQYHRILDAVEAAINNAE